MWHLLCIFARGVFISYLITIFPQFRNRILCKQIKKSVPDLFYGMELSLTPAKIVRYIRRVENFPHSTDWQTEQHVSRHPYFVWWWSSFNKPAASNRYWSLSKISDFVTDTEGVSERKWFTFCHTTLIFMKATHGKYQILDIRYS